MKELSRDHQKRLKMIGAKLRMLRKEKGYGSYGHFAWENGLPETGYLHLEQGKNFTMVTLMRVLDIHGITLEEFFKELQ